VRDIRFAPDKEETHLFQLKKTSGIARARSNNRWLAVLAGVSMAAVVATLVGAANGANTITVTLTAKGPQPKLITLNVGDSVTFTNGDAVNHSIVTKSPAGYTAGGFVSAPIRPGQSYSVGLATAGQISYVQTGFGRSYSGKILVNPVGALAITAAKTTVTYGSAVTIDGRSPIPSSTVNIVAHAKGKTGSGSAGSSSAGSSSGSSGSGGNGSWQTVATVTAGSDGSFTTTVKPTSSTTYRAQTAPAQNQSKSGQLTSSTITVAVMPQLTLRATSPRTVHQGKVVTLTGTIVPANGASTLTLIGYDVSRRSWTTISTRPVATSTGIATFRFTAPHGDTSLRLTVSKSDHLQQGLLKTATTQSLVVHGTGPIPPPTSGKHHRRKQA
jgi:plastocyanin